jgi:hypothetical protein
MQSVITNEAILSALKRRKKINQKEIQKKFKKFRNL